MGGFLEEMGIQKGPKEEKRGLEIGGIEEGIGQAFGGLKRARIFYSMKVPWSCHLAYSSSYIFPSKTNHMTAPGAFSNPMTANLAHSVTKSDTFDWHIPHLPHLLHNPG